MATTSKVGEMLQKDETWCKFDINCFCKYILFQDNCLSHKKMGNGVKLFKKGIKGLKEKIGILSIFPQSSF